MPQELRLLRQQLDAQDVLAVEAIENHVPKLAEHLQKRPYRGAFEGPSRISIGTLENEMRHANLNNSDRI